MFKSCDFFCCSPPPVVLKSSHWTKVHFILVFNQFLLLRSIVKKNYKIVIRVVNVLIFFKKRSFRYENDDEKSKTKRSFLKTIIFFKWSFLKRSQIVFIKAIVFKNDRYSFSNSSKRFFWKRLKNETKTINNPNCNAGNQSKKLSALFKLDKSSNLPHLYRAPKVAAFTEKSMKI